MNRRQFIKGAAVCLACAVCPVGDVVYTAGLGAAVDPNRYMCLSIRSVGADGGVTEIAAQDFIDKVRGSTNFSHMSDSELLFDFLSTDGYDLVWSGPPIDYGYPYISM